MRLTILALISTLCLLAADKGPPEKKPVLPRKAPEFVVEQPLPGGKKGKPILLSSFRGKVLAVAFVSTTCPHCQHLGDIMIPIQETYGPKGVQVIFVAFNESSDYEFADFKQHHGRNFIVGTSTPEIVLPFLQHPPRGHYFPNMVFIDRQGMIQAEHLGYPDYEPISFFNDMDTNVRRELNKLLGIKTSIVGSGVKK